MFKFDGISQYCNNFEDVIRFSPKYFMQFLEISWDSGICKILGFFQRFLGIVDEIYEDFQSNLPLDFTFGRLSQRSMQPKSSWYHGHCFQIFHTSGTMD